MEEATVQRIQQGPEEEKVALALHCYVRLAAWHLAHHCHPRYHRALILRLLSEETSWPQTLQEP